MALVGASMIALGGVVPTLALGPFELLPPGAEGETLGAVGERLTSSSPAPWVPYAVAVLAVVVAWLALRWLLVQGRTARVPSLRLDEEERGHTDVAARAACSALVREVCGYPGVRRGRARLTESERHPCLSLELVLAEDADPVAVWRRCRADGLARLRDSLGLDRLPTVLRLSVSGQPTGRELA
ncbi:hypothetical protein [Nocardiopsis sp. NPDC006938]|uniref:hypothetical protein n=1 Tax=Nocardiopsis sp. NPDC006938 TaxID=3364337 RepID=UPI0036A33B2C